ncbi:MAG: alkaline phosphatase family protein, partial [Acidobacteria bacterium]|nr:alkaline phosphatase family protein [Acidobacteriota bacterium]
MKIDFSEELRDRQQRLNFRFLSQEPNEADIRLFENDMADSDVFIWYMSCLDRYGHILGPHPERYSSGFESIANFIDSVHHLAKENGDADVVLFSDHGMAQVTESHDMWE